MRMGHVDEVAAPYAMLLTSLMRAVNSKVVASTAAAITNSTGIAGSSVGALSSVLTFREREDDSVLYYYI